MLEWSLDGMPTAVAPVVRQGAQIKQARLVERAQATPLFVGRTRTSLEQADLSILETEAEKRGDLTAPMDSEATLRKRPARLSVRYTLHGQSLKRRPDPRKRGGAYPRGPAPAGYLRLCRR